MYYELLLDERARPAARRRARPSARSRAAIVDALPRRRRRPRTAEEHFDRLHVDHEAAGRDARSTRRRRRRAGPPAGAARARPSASRAREARRLLGQGGVQARRRAARRRSDLDLPADALDGRVLQVGKRRFARARRGGLRRLRGLAAVRARTTRASVALDSADSRAAPALGLRPTAALYSAASPEALLRPEARSRDGVPVARRARRSLKTQQHAHRGPIGSEVCVQVRPAGAQPGLGGLRMNPSCRGRPVYGCRTDDP